MGGWLHVLLELFTQTNFGADFILLKLNFIFKTKKSLFESPFVDLWVTYALHLYSLERPIRHNLTFSLTVSLNG